jgi:protein TonB
MLQGLSGGPGGPRGMGSGTGTSIGEGVGNDGSINGAFTAGHGVSMPVPVHKVEPEYSERARKAKMSGVVLVACVVGADGLPRELQVMRSLGMGLDEKAVDAVSKWRFKPGTRAGHAVAVKAVIEVSFRIL